MARKKAADPKPKNFRALPAQTPAETSQMSAATRSRKKFEADNPARMQTIVDRPFGESGRTGRELGISPRLGYRLHGIEETTAIHPRGQQELPGMGSVTEARHIGMLGTENTPMHQSRTLPDLAPAPKQWHEMHPVEQAKTLRLARRFGVTPESMHQSFGAQLDQAHLRGQEHGQTPYAAHFYAGNDPSRPSTPDAMQPRDVLLHSAQHNDVDFSTQAVANGITSPKSKFSMTSRATGRTVYPNDEAATFAIRHVQGGGAPEHADPSGQGIIALHGNVRRAAHAAQQRVEGRSLGELRNPGGTSPFGPKTGPYTNSWLDPHGSSQFFVSDVHSGGGGMAPHVSHDNPYARDEEGNIAKTAGGRNKKTTSSPREQYLGIPGIHALHHHVVQQVMAERGLHSTSGAQAAQWGEEQVGRGAEGGSARKQTLVPMEKAYPSSSPTPQIHGQMDIYGGESRGTDVAAHKPPLNAQQFEEPTGKDRVAAEAKIAAVRRNVQRKRGTPTAKDLGNEPHEGWG